MGGELPLRCKNRLAACAVRLARGASAPAEKQAFVLVLVLLLVLVIDSFSAARCLRSAIGDPPTLVGGGRHGRRRLGASAPKGVEAWGRGGMGGELPLRCKNRLAACVVRLARGASAPAQEQAPILTKSTRQTTQHPRQSCRGASSAIAVSSWPPKPQGARPKTFWPKCRAGSSAGVLQRLLAGGFGPGDTRAALFAVAPGRLQWACQCSFFLVPAREKISCDMASAACSPACWQ